MTKKKTTTKKPVKKESIPTLEEWIKEVFPVVIPKKQSEQSENQSQQSG